jgi:hypothetical protein
MNDVEFAAPMALPFSLPGLTGVGETVVEIGPANIAQITRMLRLAKPLVDDIAVLSPELIDRAVDGAPTSDDIARVLELVCERAEMAAELVSAATGIELARVQALLPDRFVYLLALVVQVNADFFDRSAAAWSAAKGLLQGAMNKARSPAASGSTPSTS